MTRRPSLVLGLGLGLLLATPAGAESEFQAMHDKARQIQDRWASGPLLQPLRADGADAADAAWSAELRAAVLAMVRRWNGLELIEGGPLSSALGAAGTAWGLGDGLIVEARSVQGRVPAWLQDALRQQVAAQALPARRLDRPLRQQGWLGASRDGQSDTSGWEAPIVWAGPAVRDGVASYRSEGGQTRIRLAIGGGQDLWRIAQARGVAVRVSLDDGGQPLAWAAPLPLRLELQLPVWLVTPQELLPATLTVLRTGDSCAGGHTELRLAGERQPPVWAVLFLPDEAAGRAARVRRIAPPPEPEGQSPQADAVSRLELSWPDRRLPTLHLVAKRFGDLWGSYVQQADRPPEQQGRLSAAGSPECAPR